MFNQPIEKDTKIFTLKSIKNANTYSTCINSDRDRSIYWCKNVKVGSNFAAANNGQVNSDFAANSKIVASSKIATSSKIAARIINCGIFPCEYSYFVLLHLIVSASSGDVCNCRSRVASSIPARSHTFSTIDHENNFNSHSPPFTLTLQGTRRIYDSMNRSKIEFIAYNHILL